MQPKLAFIGIPLLREIYNQLIREKKLEGAFMYEEASFEELPATIARLNKEEDIDVVISGSGYIHRLQGTGITVVAINVTGFDVLNALTEMKKKSNRVVFMRFGIPFENVEKYSDTVNMEIVSSFYLNREDARIKIKEFMDRGHDSFIGSGLMCDVVNELGGNFSCYYSRDSVAAAIENGWQLAMSLRTEIDRREQLNIILENSQQGIIAINQQLICTLVNSEAQKILGLKQTNLIHRSVSEFWPLKTINTCLEHAQSKFQVVEKVDQKEFLVDYNVNFVKQSISGLVITFQDISMVRAAEQAVRRNKYDRNFSAEYRFSDIVGSSHLIQSTVYLAQMYAKSDSTVLISGESGTGKELFAQSIHAASIRNQMPFIPVNCAAITGSLLESELFGYEEGAFTGAKKGGKSGLFELAHEGTLYLDEIGEVSFDMQSRLLRVLQEKKIRRVGGSTLSLVDVRIVAATNRDIKKMVLQGTFREDLYFRLNVLPLFVPPLRERIEDLSQLIHYFCTKYLSEDHTERIVEKILNESNQYSWPGNIRELENVVQRLVVIQQCERKEDQEYLAKLTFSDMVVESINRGLPVENRPSQSRPNQLLPENGFRDHKRHLELDYIFQVLDQFKGNKTKAAEFLGISRSTLWKKLNG